MKTSQHISRRTLPVEWRSHEWAAAIHRRPIRLFPRHRGSVWPGASAARSFTDRQPMVNLASFMNNRHSSRFQRPQAFTLIEMLVVIAIIAILAGILLPTLASIKVKAKIKQAQMEMANLAAAIKAYEAEYNRFPSSADAERNGKPDFTFGTTGTPVTPAVITGGLYEANNSEVMFILLNHVNHPAAPPSVKNRNPRSLTLFDAKMVQDGLPGIGTSDHIFRDPWGNPYIISVDLDDDNQCVDGYYCKFPGQAGFVGTFAPYKFNGSLMIWSFGPDGRAGTQNGINYDKDNVLSWKH